jgi:hypothetical protein
MTLLKRKPETNGYKTVEEFSFMGNKEKVEQGKLF